MSTIDVHAALRQRSSLEIDRPRSSKDWWILLVLGVLGFANFVGVLWANGLYPGAPYVITTGRAVCNPTVSFWAAIGVAVCAFGASLCFALRHSKKGAQMGIRPDYRPPSSTGPGRAHEGQQSAWIKRLDSRLAAARWRSPWRRGACIVAIILAFGAGVATMWAFDRLPPRASIGKTLK